jgi:hypothetical protein
MDQGSPGSCLAGRLECLVGRLRPARWFPVGLSVPDGVRPFSVRSEVLGSWRSLPLLLGQLADAVRQGASMTGASTTRSPDVGYTV